MPGLPIELGAKRQLLASSISIAATAVILIEAGAWLVCKRTHLAECFGVGLSSFRRILSLQGGVLKSRSDASDLRDAETQQRRCEDNGRGGGRVEGGGRIDDVDLSFNGSGDANGDSDSEKVAVQQAENHSAIPRANVSSVSACTETSVLVAQAVRAQGVCIMEGVFDEAELAALSAAVNALSPRKKQNRRAGRWEYVHEPQATPFTALASHALLSRVVRALLGSKTYLEKAGVLVSHPGAEAQRWHMDTPHLFTSRPHLPPHSLTLFIPLVAVDAAIGPTQFQLGTHVKATLAQPHKHYVLACCDAGDVVAYDPRVMHRGTQNQSDRERPVVYLTFSRVWYRDTLNP